MSFDKRRIITLRKFQDMERALGNFFTMKVVYWFLDA